MTEHDNNEWKGLVNINSVPKEFWFDEFKPDARKNFKDSYIDKIMFDHLFRQKMDEVIKNIITQLNELKTKLSYLEDELNNSDEEEVKSNFLGE